MSKLKLSKKEIIAVKESIVHWKEDIRKNLLNGGKIVASESPNGPERLYWEGDNVEVKCYSSSCPLCLMLIARIGTVRCKDCPYFRKYHIECGNESSGWSKFYNNPTLEICNRYIKSLERILK